MTTFKDDIADDLADFFNTDEMAQTVTYSDGVTPAEIAADIDYTIPGKDPGDYALIRVKKSDVSNPDYRHTFTIDSVVWTVFSDKKRGLEIKDDGQVLTIPISKNEGVIQWRP